MIFTKDKITVKLYDSRKEMGEIAASDTAAKIEELLLVKDEINIIFAAAPSQNEFLASFNVEGILSPNHKATFIMRGIKVIIKEYLFPSQAFIIPSI